MGADGVGVKSPFFAVNFAVVCLCSLGEEEKSEENEEKRKKAKKCVKTKRALKMGKITPTPSTPTPLRTSQGKEKAHKHKHILLVTARMGVS